MINHSAYLENATPTPGRQQACDGPSPGLSIGAFKWTLITCHSVNSVQLVGIRNMEIYILYLNTSYSLKSDEDTVPLIPSPFCSLNPVDLVLVLYFSWVTIRKRHGVSIKDRTR